MSTFERLFGGSKDRQNERAKQAKEEMDASLKRDFDALDPQEQERLLQQERAELRNEIDSLRGEADKLEQRFDELVRGRAELTLNKRLRGVE